MSGLAWPLSARDSGLSHGLCSRLPTWPGIRPGWSAGWVDPPHRGPARPSPLKHNGYMVIPIIPSSIGLRKIFISYSHLRNIYGVDPRTGEGSKSSLETLMGVGQRTGPGTNPCIPRVVSKPDSNHGTVTMAQRTLGLMPVGTICHSNLSLSYYPIKLIINIPELFLNSLKQYLINLHLKCDAENVL